MHYRDFSGVLTKSLFLVFIVFIFSLSACVSHGDFGFAFEQIDVKELKDPLVCARFVIQQKLLAGEYIYTTEKTEKAQVDERLTIENLKVEYTIYDGFEGHLKKVHSQAQYEILETTPYGETLTFDLPYDANNSPERLIAPFFDLKVTFTVNKLESNYNTRSENLGFESGRYILEDTDSNLPPQTHYPEGFCGKTYRYLLFNPDGNY